MTKVETIMSIATICIGVSCYFVDNIMEFIGTYNSSFIYIFLFVCMSICLLEATTEEWE